jgi:hypothetical protein
LGSAAIARPADKAIAAHIIEIENLIAHPPHIQKEKKSLVQFN